MNNFLKGLFLVVIIIFLVMFFSSGNGYYEYELGKKNHLTEDAISRFEQDIKDGKEIDVNDYIVSEINYDNKFSRAGITISNNINKIFSEGMKFIFDSIGNFVNE